MTPSIVYSAPAPDMADFKTSTVKKAVYSERSRGLAGMLLAAAVAALVVVADQLVSTWADGHLFLAWVAMWAVVFASMAVFTGAARRLSQRLVLALDAWARDRAEARAEARFMVLAQRDPRMMAEFRRAQAQVQEMHHEA
jgi:FtsH-binding integral membrane protein